MAENPAALSAFNASSGYLLCSSTSAACGAISFSHKSRITERSSMCSSASLKRSKSGLPDQLAITTPCYSLANLPGRLLAEQPVLQRGILVVDHRLEVTLKAFYP